MAAAHHRPLHALLGGGAVADLLLWRRRNASAAAVAGATLVWFLFERAGYSLASVLSNAVLLLVDILFLWAKSASLLNRFFLFVTPLLYGRRLHGFEIFAFPCNQFGGQELGIDKEIVQIACTRFHAEYLIFDKGSGGDDDGRREVRGLDGVGRAGAAH